MMISLGRLAALGVGGSLLTLAARAQDVTVDAPVHELFAQRVQSVVAVEFFVETEIDRRPSTVVGMVADAGGLVVLLDSAIPGWLPPSQIKDFVIYRPGANAQVPADYLGQDFLTGWHFIRARDGLDHMIPVTDYPTEVPQLGSTIWGIGLMGKDFDFQPYLMTGQVAVVQELPQQVAFAVDDIASPGAPIFGGTGRLVGWATNPVPQERFMLLEDERYSVALQNPNASGGFFLISEVLPYLDRAPEAPTGQKIPWLGVVGLQPVDREVAAFLKLENRSAVIISDVIENGPAAKAGIQRRDIILSLDGKPLPRFSPERVVSGFLEREIMMRAPGEIMRLGVARGTERLDFEVTIGVQPRSLKEAERHYFERLGITLREFVLFDRVSRQLTEVEDSGVVANFVKPSSPAATAGLRAGDLITAIDGETVTGYAQAVALVTAIEQDVNRKEFVLLTSRGTETSLIRVQLK